MAKVWNKNLLHDKESNEPHLSYKNRCYAYLHSVYKGVWGHVAKSIGTLGVLMSGIQYYNVTALNHAHCTEPT